jgi:hypothetical protein
MFYTGVVPDSFALNVMFSAENDFFNDSKIGKIDESERLLDARSSVDTLDGANDLSEGREVFDEFVLGDRFLERGHEHAPFIFTFLFLL